MYERVLERCRQKIRARDYLVTLHADEEMDADGYSILDVEFGILRGRILEKQRDQKSRESKYRIGGNTSTGRGIEVVVKFGPTGTLVVLTAYEP